MRRAARSLPGPLRGAPASAAVAPSRRLVRSAFVLACLLALPGLARAGRGLLDPATGKASLEVAFREVPSSEELAEARESFTRAALLLCDATEGQVRIDTVRFTTSPTDEDGASIWVHDADAASGGPYASDGGDLHRLGAHLDAFRSALARPDRLAHLLAHHLFGLGDQYDDQRRRGGSCGIGPGFDLPRMDERNHSIMQASGSMRCGSGALLGQECLRDAECGGAPCRVLMASEFSTPANHDPLRGNGDACPQPGTASRLRLDGLLPSTAEPMGPFDGSGFLAARATSCWHREVEIPAADGSLPGHRLHLYLAHLQAQDWQLALATESSPAGSARGAFQVVATFALHFNPDFSLASIAPRDPRVALPSAPGVPPVVVSVDLGTTAADGQGSGAGYDGLQMVKAGNLRVSLDLAGGVGCTAAWCASSWNSDTGRFERTEQGILHGDASDWQTLHANLPFLKVPSRVEEAPPASCQLPPRFLQDVAGADQVVLVVDTSRSMGARVDGRRGEVCGNGTDDDGDGRTDEDECADSRLEYARIALRAFLMLAADRKAQFGMVAMNTEAELLREMKEPGEEPRSELTALLGSLVPEGDTAIGAALERAQAVLKKAEGRSRSIVLLSDGANNAGIEPGREANVLDPLSYRVFPVPVGRGADTASLSAVAARTGGAVTAAPEVSSAPAALVELSARLAGDALLLPRTRFDLARSSSSPAGKGLASSRTFSFQVEENAGELVVFVGSRNDRVGDWRMLFEMVAPGGEVIDDASPYVQSERGFVVVRVPDARAGTWNLRLMAGAAGIQRTEVLAWSRSEHADLMVDASPRLAKAGEAVRLSARPAWGTDLEGDLSLQAVVRAPDGNESSFPLSRDAVTGAWGADLVPVGGRGFYEVRFALRVGDARPLLGEPVFPGAPRALTRVVPLERSATASFEVVDGTFAPCPGTDCDEDGIAERDEEACPRGTDADGDGIPNRLDADSDNDEILDSEEANLDLDHDGVPDFCQPEKTPASMEGILEADEAASATACSADAQVGRDRLAVSLSGLRRILQVVRVKPGIAAPVRAELVQDLQQAVESKKQALVAGGALPDFCLKYRSHIEQALAIERRVRVRVDPLLAVP